MRYTELLLRRNRLRLRLGLGGCDTENNGEGFIAPGGGLGLGAAWGVTWA